MTVVCCSTFGEPFSGSEGLSLRLKLFLGPARLARLPCDEIEICLEDIRGTSSIFHPYHTGARQKKLGDRVTVRKPKQFSVYLTVIAGAKKGAVRTPTVTSYLEISWQSRRMWPLMLSVPQSERRT